MPRIQFSDVTPPERRSIRDVPIPSGGKRKVPLTSIKPEKPKIQKPENPEPESNVSYFNPPVPRVDNPSIINQDTTHPNDTSPSIIKKNENKNSNAYEYYYPKEKRSDNKIGNTSKPKKKRWFFGTVIIIMIVAFIVCMMTVFSSATIDITPKNQEINVDTEINAFSKVDGGTVKYEVVKLSKTKTISVPATGEEMVELKASGKIVIYNNFSSESQRLIIRTRFESPEGLIYRIPESVIVPGKTIKDGVEIPGSVEVTVFADEAGDKYNIKKTDFTIPGFKNDTARFKGFYARSATNMDGGFVGKQKVVLPTDKQTALESIDSELQADLQKDLSGRVPDGLALLSGAISYESKEMPQSSSDSGAILGREMTAYAIMLNARDLSNTIIKENAKELPGWENIKSEIKDFSFLSIANLPANFETNDKISLQIKGIVKIWAEINIDNISQRLLGTPKKDVAKLMDEFAEISSIKSAVRPVWKQSFPKDSFRIHIKAVY